MKRLEMKSCNTIYYCSVPSDVITENWLNEEAKELKK